MVVRIKAQSYVVELSTICDRKNTSTNEYKKMLCVLRVSQSSECCLPRVPCCLLTGVSFIRVLLHQIPDEVFSCKKTEERMKAVELMPSSAAT